MSDEKECDREPLPLGTLFDGHAIVEVVQCDPRDSYQPHLYLLANGDTVWIGHDDSWISAAPLLRNL